MQLLDIVHHTHQQDNDYTELSSIGTTKSSTVSDLYAPHSPSPTAVRISTSWPLFAPTSSGSTDVDTDKQAVTPSTRHNQSSRDTSLTRTLTPIEAISSHTTSTLTDSLSATMNISKQGYAGGNNHNNSRSSSPATNSRDNHHHHTRQESGYQSSTIGTNSIPPMTIGVKRGSDLLASRRGPQITGNTFNAPGNNASGRGGSAPPLSSSGNHHTYANSKNANTSTGNISIQEVFDLGEYQQRAFEYDNAIAGGVKPAVRPVYVGNSNNNSITQAQNGTLGHDDDEHSEDDEEEEDDEEASEDDGIERAQDYIDDRESQIDNYGTLPIDADPAHNNNKVTKSQSQSQQGRRQSIAIGGNAQQQQQQQQQPFYQLQQYHPDEDEEGNRSPMSAGSEARGQLLSTEALAGESYHPKYWTREEGTPASGPRLKRQKPPPPAHSFHTSPFSSLLIFSSLVHLLFCVLLIRPNCSLADF